MTTALSEAQFERDNNRAKLEVAKSERDTARAEVERLKQESTAQVSAAYEAAASVADRYHDAAIVWAKGVRGLSDYIGETDSSRIATEIRALTPADAKAALYKMLRQARAEAMREAATICNTSYGDGLGDAHKRIIARVTEIEKEERK